MHTKDFLSQQLRAAGLDAMADKAATGYYHDYLSPLDTPDLQLFQDLTDAGTDAALKLRARHVHGAFDASLEEGEEWMASQEGQQAVASLARK